MGSLLHEVEILIISQCLNSRIQFILVYQIYR